MKHLYLSLAAAAVALPLCASAPGPLQLAGAKNKEAISCFHNGEWPAKVISRVTVEELFAAPENTVLDGPYIPDQVGYSGFQNSDLGRPGMPTRFYQAFHGCYKSVNSCRVIGMFNFFDDENYDWLPCDSRGGRQEDYTLTEPVTFEVAFYRENEDGTPGEVVYKKNIDIIGRYMGLTYGNEGAEMPMYEFTADLGEEINLECGFMSFAAADLGDSPACWFSLFTADTSLDFAMMDMGDYGLMYANMPCIFSLMGDGSMAARKALRIDRLSAPSASASGTHEKTTVKIMNVGSDDISDVTLELWLDGALMATEKVNASIPAGGSYAYTFMHRLDLSATGEHTVTVKNVTPGDENISRMLASAKTYVCAPGETCESSAEYEDDTCFISHVSVGDIDNESGDDLYADYYDSQILSLSPGKSYTMEMEPMEVAVTGVWIDWNENGTFNDPGEYIGYIYDEPLEIAIPEGLSVKEGKKRMRLVMDYYNSPASCGSYYFGETEDYGVIVTRNENTPAASVDVDELAVTTEQPGISEMAFELANVGSAPLEASISMDYSLPVIYEPRAMAPARDFKGKAEMRRAEVGNAEPAAEENVQHVLGYDGGFDSAIALSNYEAGVFAQYYPAAVMAGLKGMKVSSVDVYINDAPENASIKIYGEGAFGVAGEVIAEQPFTAVAQSWNHVVLDNPVEITGSDLWYGIEIIDMQADKYYVGIDAVSAVAGYGDLCNIGGQTWWSMSDLGVDHNFCIRANVIGERTAAINWLDVDKKNVALNAGEMTGIKATLNYENLGQGVYEATVKINSNDELTPVVAIPVYLTNGVMTGIETSRLNRTSVRVADGCIVISSDDNIAAVQAFDMTGRSVASTTPGRTQNISLDNFAAGVYIINVMYGDGSREAFKIAVAR